MKKILSISGGGIRGIIPATVVATIEGMLNAPASQLFDLVAGTSTGGIIACGLGAGLPASKMYQMYLQRGSEIFHRPWWRHGTFIPKYPTIGIDKVLGDVFAAGRFSTAKTKLLVPSYDQEKDQPMHFKSWDCDKDLCYFDVCRATSSAPTYFGAYEGKYSDGGLFANDPSLNAYAEAKLLWPGEQIKVLHLGTGFKPSSKKCPSNGGASEWLPAILGILMSAPARDVDYMCKAILGDDYLSLQPQIPGYINEAMDDASDQNLSDLGSFANAISTANVRAITMFLQKGK